jgi:hypothetical protein
LENKKCLSNAISEVSLVFKSTNAPRSPQLRLIRADYSLWARMLAATIDVREPFCADAGRKHAGQLRVRVSFVVHGHQLFDACLRVSLR